MDKELVVEHIASRRRFPPGTLGIGGAATTSGWFRPHLFFDGGFEIVRIVVVVLLFGVVSVTGIRSALPHSSLLKSGADHWGLPGNRFVGVKIMRPQHVTRRDTAAQLQHKRHVLLSLTPNIRHKVFFSLTRRRQRWWMMALIFLAVIWIFQSSKKCILVVLNTDFTRKCTSNMALIWWQQFLLMSLLQE